MLSQVENKLERGRTILEKLVENVREWFKERNLHTGDPLKQWEKLVEEFGELVKGKNKYDVDVIKDSIGDMTVVLIGMCLQKGLSLTAKDLENSDGKRTSTIEMLHSIYNMYTFLDLDDDYMLPLHINGIIGALNDVSEAYSTTLEECLALAYDEIKDRKGKLIDGVFVKEDDL